MEYTKGEWKLRGNLVEVLGRGIVAICPSPQADGVMEFIANAHLIVAAVNACASINLDNPMAIAESIKDMYEACKTTLRQIDAWSREWPNKAHWYGSTKTMLEQVLAKAEGKNE